MASARGAQRPQDPDDVALDEDDGPDGAGPSLQPFECLVCGRRFTRHENLKRHSAIHRAPKDLASIRCAHCTSTFSRRDLRRRHMKRKHPLEKGSDDEAEDPPAEGGGRSKSKSTEHQGKEKDALALPRASTSTVPPDPQTSLALGHGSGMVSGGFSAETALGESTGALSSEPAFGSLARGADPSPGLQFDFGVASGSWSPVDIDGLMQEITGTASNVSGPGTGTSQSMAHSISQPQYSAQNQSQTQPPQRPTMLWGGNSSLSPPVPLTFGHTRQSFSDTDALLTPALVQKGCDLFFRHAAHCFFFVHRATFDADSVPRPLLLGVLSIGLLFAGTHDNEARELASECYHRGKALLADEAAWKEDLSSSARALGIIQALLLLGTHSIMFIGEEETQHGFRLHSKCVEMARKGGLMEPYPAQTSGCDNLDSLWRNAMRIESHKRTLFGIYQYDAVWYCILSRPRYLSHLEIKHDLPCSEDLWTAPSAEAWAHLSLVGAAAKVPPVRYIDAVRNTLSTGPVLPGLAANPLGILLVIMFHFTSIREVSGWSTMTGRTSFERFEALHSSLRLLESAATGSKGLVQTPTLTSCEITWHISMIELSLWSQPHTGGLVEGSLAAALAAATMLIAAHPVPISPEIAESLESHMTWMTTYLSSTTDTTLEPPWVTVYLFKASLMALQIVGMGMTNSVDRLGISTPREMLLWMRQMFARRSVWSVGRLICQSLDELEGVVS